MGMDIIGTQPANPLGEYFRSGASSWGPLWRLCQTIAGDIIPRSNSGYFNDGFGVGGSQSRKLADTLESALERDTAESFFVTYFKDSDADESYRSSDPYLKLEDGENKRMADYLDHCRAFEVFCRHCGGFAID